MLDYVVRERCELRREFGGLVWFHTFGSLSCVSLIALKLIFFDLPDKRVFSGFQLSFIYVKCRIDYPL